MLDQADRDAAIDRAVVAAADEIDAATDNQAERDMMWWLLCGGVFIAAIAEADAAGQLSMATRLNDALETEGVPWRLVAAD